MILKNIIPTSILTNIRTYVSNLFVQKVDNTNTATGTNSVSIEGKSGVANFTDTVTQGSPLEAVITNSYFEVNSVVITTLEYPIANTGVPIIAHVDLSTAGQMTIVIENLSVSITSTDLKVGFMIVS